VSCKPSEALKDVPFPSRVTAAVLKGMKGLPEDVVSLERVLKK
jgi:hypothetical protein